PWIVRALAGATIIALAGCATEPPVTLPAPLRPPLADTDASSRLPDETGEREKPVTRFKSTPKPPPAKPAPTGPVLSQLTEQGQRQVTLNIEGLTVPAFINEVYGNLLGLSFQMGAGVQGKTELVNLRLTTPQPASKVRALADQALGDYGVSVEPRGEVLRFATGASATPATPDSPVFVFRRKLPASIPDQTSVVQFFTLDAVRNTQVAGWLRQAFQGQKVTINEDAERNALMLAGPAGMVRQAAEAASLLDQPFMRGQHSLRIEPANWTASALAKRLEEILQAEGYSASRSVTTGGSVLVLPVDEINAVLVFAADPGLLIHVRQWVSQLDQTRQGPEQDGLFYYLAKNVPADSLVKTLAPLLPSLTGANAPPGAAMSTTSPARASQIGAPQTGVPPAAGGTASAATTPTTQSGGFVSNLVVDASRNALIFSGSSEQWARLRPVLEAMDQPAKLALIEVTVAEITLGDTQDTGIEWVFKNVNIGNWEGTLTNALDVGTDGFSYGLTNEGSVILLNALATNNRVSILSNPRVMVRNSQEATIDVGTEVPIITSQSTTDTGGTGGNPAILQQIQYRKTGVLLKVKPTIYAGRRVDLEVEQEVSEAQRNTTSTISSPQILNRKINTSLSLKDGGSVLLGGLVSTNRSTSNRGIPILKDVPLLGALFRADNQSTNRTELVVLITPYIVSDEREAEAITEAFRQRLNFAKTPASEAPPE
ncbi:MAG: hypothetical protein WAV07_04455, partial [Candidatus Contendobacter sp.]